MLLVAIAIRSVSVISWQASAKSLDDLYARYNTGDVEFIAREFTSPGDFPTNRAVVDSVLKRWHDDWTPRRATFLMEMAVAASRIGALQEMTTLVTAGGTFVLQRPARFGSQPEEDRFEATWHRAALGLLMTHRLYYAEDIYLSAVEKRYRQAGRPDFDPRIPLLLAEARVQRCCSESAFAQAADPVSEGTRAVGGSTGAPDASGQEATRGLADWTKATGSTGSSAIDDAIGLFDRARQSPASHAEASVRGAALLLHRGKPARALEWLGALDLDSRDAELVYLAHLMTGRAFDALNRYSDAAREYRRALAAWPNAQSASIALALDLTRLGQLDDAAAVAQAAASGLTGAKDPWWTYDLAEARFVDLCVTALRKATQ